MVFFDLPMRGDWVALSVVVALFLVGALGTGLLVSTIAETQQVAFQAAALIALLPTFMLSGFIFPIASMPIALQYITTIVPAQVLPDRAARRSCSRARPQRVCGAARRARDLCRRSCSGLSALRLARR